MGAPGGTIDQGVCLCVHPEHPFDLCSESRVASAGILQERQALGLGPFQRSVEQLAHPSIVVGTHGVEIWQLRHESV